MILYKSFTQKIIYPIHYINLLSIHADHHYGIARKKWYLLVINQTLGLAELSVSSVSTKESLNLSSLVIRHFRSLVCSQICLFTLYLYNSFAEN